MKTKVGLFILGRNDTLASLTAEQMLTTLYAWINKTKSSKETNSKMNNVQLINENRRLKKVLTEVKVQRDILKKATAYFARESQ